MTTSLSSRFVAAAVLATAALGAASAAQAGSNVYLSIGVPAPVYVQPAPVYARPAPVFGQQGPVYYVQPRPVYVQPPAYGYVYEDGRNWRRAEWQRRQWQHHHRDWDRNDRRRD